MARWTPPEHCHRKNSFVCICLLFCEQIVFTAKVVSIMVNGSMGSSMEQVSTAPLEARPQPNIAFRRKEKDRKRH